MNNSTTFRPYTASDRAALIGIIREAWHYDRFASPKTAARMARLFLDSCLASQTFTQVAVSDDVPVGIIMAKDRLQHRPAFMHRLRQWRSLAALVAHREGREVMQIFADVHHVDDHLLASCSRHYDSEIVFFAISGHMRGQSGMLRSICVKKGGSTAFSSPTPAAITPSMNTSVSRAALKKHSP